MNDLEIRRIIAANRPLNAFIRPQDLMQMAAQEPDADGILSGMCIGTKDNIALAGHPWTAGIAARIGCIAARDAHVVSLLRQAGATVLGGLNMDEAALGATTDNPHFGRTLNPLDPTRSPGGSSGGSAAAVAAGLVDLALGSDTMGSVRIPAAYCGVMGLKPTRGRIGRSGVHPLAPELDTVGFFARDPAGLERLLTALTAFDADDPASRIMPRGAVPRDLSQLTIGVPTCVASVPCDPAVSKALAAAQSALERAGATVRPVDMAGWDAAALESATFLWTEAQAALALADDLDRPGGVSDALSKMLDYGRRVSSAKLVAARAQMDNSSAAADRAFATVDLLLTPTTPHLAFAFDTPVPQQQAIFTVLANVAGLPALAVPVLLPASRLPASVQLMGPAWSDTQLLAAATAMLAALAT